MCEPQTLLAAVRYFSDLDRCEAYLRQLRWPGGRVRCPECESTNVGEAHGYTDERIESLIAGASTQRVLLEAEIELRESITRQYGAGLSPAQQRMQADEIIAQRRERSAKEAASDASATP